MAGCVLISHSAAHKSSRFDWLRSARWGNETWWRRERWRNARSHARRQEVIFSYKRDAWMQNSERQPAWSKNSARAFDWERCLSGREHCLTFSAVYNSSCGIEFCLPSIRNHCSNRKHSQKRWQFFRGRHTFVFKPQRKTFYQIFF